MDSFHPPFCPNTRCVHHHANLRHPYVQYTRWGRYPSLAFGKVQRFICMACHRTFSVQTFSPSYCAKRDLDFGDIIARLVSTSGLRAIGRALGISCDSVSNRVERAARQVLAAESRLSPTRRPTEDLCADGFESYCVSRYFPNNINLLVGKSSQFVYATNQVTIRRKGRMTEQQRKRRAQLETRFMANPKGIEQSFCDLIREGLHVLSDEHRPRLELWTDRKQEYGSALGGSPVISALLRSCRLVHATVSSRQARTADNPLFAVNYIDREIRKDLHEHVRETSCFGRNVNRQMERLTVYLFFHNYLKPHRVARGEASHAEFAGSDHGEIKQELAAIWKDRARLARVSLTDSMLQTWLRSRETPLKERTEHIPLYAC